MILGYVLDKKPRIKLTLRGRSSPITIDFVVDTGFEGFLALPTVLLNRLEAVYDGDQTIQTATGTFSDEYVYLATVNWDGQERTVEIISVGSGIALLGVELLAGNLVTLDMTEGGEVTIEPQ